MKNNDLISMNGGLSAAFYTLGCRVNQYETQAIEEQFRDAGFQIKSFDDVCDVYVINTCTVTQESDRKSRQIIRRASQLKKPTSVVVVCGCYAQGNPSDIVKIDGVDLIIGNFGKTGICSLACEYLKEKREKLLVTDISTVSEYENAFITSSDRTRAFVKIVDGCENHCSYCIIPSVRGKIRSRSIRDIIDEVTLLSENGYKEVVLTGIETAAYGRDFDKKTESPLSQLIKEVASIEKIQRIRLGSMEPTVFTEEFVKDISKISKLMPHFHLSLQSGSNEILRLMKRKYNTTKFLEIINRIRDYIPGVQLTTDIIVGFPGETQGLFNETLSFIEKCNFSFIHIFPYSRRDGTPAATMSGQLDKATKKERVSILENAMYKIRGSILETYIGRKIPVLFETEAESFVDGHTPEYIKVKVPVIKKSDSLSGEISDVIITGITTDDDGSSCLAGNLA